MFIILIKLIVIYLNNKMFFWIGDFWGKWKYIVKNIEYINGKKVFFFVKFIFFFKLNNELILKGN